MQKGAQPTYFREPHMSNSRMRLASRGLGTPVLGNPVEIRTPTHWNLISRSTITPPPVLSPSSILPPPLSHRAFIPAMKIFGARFKHVIISIPYSIF